jgi:hypothetical protein
MIDRRRESWGWVQGRVGAAAGILLASALANAARRDKECEPRTRLAQPRKEPVWPRVARTERRTASQQLAAVELDEVIDAIRAGVAYANVHTTPLSPGGEIRGQINASNRRGQDD